MPPSFPPLDPILLISDRVRERRRNVLRNAPPLTQRLAKRVVAEALSRRLDGNNLNNAEGGDILGCGEGTIRNRLDRDDDGKQMTVYELARGIRAWGAAFGTDILDRLAGVRCEANGTDHAPDPIAFASESACVIAEVLKAAADRKFEFDEAKALLPFVDRMDHATTALGNYLRDVIAKGPTR